MRQLLLAVVLVAIPVALFSGYEVYSPHPAAAATAGLGDLGALKAIIDDVTALAEKGDLSGAARRITDFESAWDQGETAIRPLNRVQWGHVDDAADAALHALRQPSPTATEVLATLADLNAILDDPSKTPNA